MRHAYYAVWVILSIAIITYGFFIMNIAFSTPGTQVLLSVLGGGSIGVGFPILTLTIHDWIEK